MPIRTGLKLKKRVQPIRDLVWILKIRKMFPTLRLRSINRAYLDIRKIEKNIIGRYAGSTIDKLAHTLPVLAAAIQAPEDRNMAHMEIGILFGGGIVSKLIVLQHARINHEVIAIDPLDGYYGKNLDPIAKISVDEDNFWKNIEKFKLSKDQVHLIKRFSNDPLALQEIENTALLSLFIDGDHSYKGVKDDWENYSPFVREGGYVIFDDYNDDDWPDVKQFVDELIQLHPKPWVLIGVLDTTIIFQKKEAPTD